MQPAPHFAVPMQAADPQLGPIVSEHHVGGKRYWSVFGLVLFLGLIALAGFIATLAEGALLGAVFLGLLMLSLVLVLIVLSGVRITVYTHGIERRGRFGRKRLGWDALQSYTLSIVDPSQAAAGAGGVIGML